MFLMLRKINNFLVQIINQRAGIAIGVIVVTFDSSNFGRLEIGLKEAFALFSLIRCLEINLIRLKEKIMIDNDKEVVLVNDVEDFVDFVFEGGL
jgi:hypothetical protein